MHNCESRLFSLVPVLDCEANNGRYTMSCVPNQDPDQKIDPICRIPYGILLLGVLIAFLSSFKLQLGATGYQIHWTLFVYGLIPYLVYSGFLVMSNGKWLAVTGIILVLADVGLRVLAPDLNLLAGYGPLWLVLLVLVTVGLGILAARQRTIVHPEEPQTPESEPNGPS